MEPDRGGGSYHGHIGELEKWLQREEGYNSRSISSEVG